MRIQALLVCAAFACCFACCHATAIAAAEDPTDSYVLGIDELEVPPHDEQYAVVQQVSDPLERVNRVSFALTKPVVHWGLRPLAKGWRGVSSAAVRRSVGHFAYNLAFPVRLMSLVLRGQPMAAGEETGHFVVNTTLGVAGLFDPAARIGLATQDGDIGRAFAAWGIGSGPYVFLPLLGPSTARDAVGRVFDLALNPVTYAPVPGLGVFLAANAFTDRVDGYDQLVTSYPDPYLPVRALWMLHRRVEVEGYEIPAADWDRADPEPSLGNMLFGVTEPDFWRRARRRTVTMPTTGRRLPYTLWLRDEPSSLRFIIPGIGAHRESSNPAGLAQLAFDRGYSVAIVSSPFHPEFIRAGLTATYPGSTPSDAADLYSAMVAIAGDVESLNPDGVRSAKILGYSLGALEAVFIAAAQAGYPDGALRFARVVAVNPPVDLLFAGRQFDAYFSGPLAWPEAERERRVRNLAMKAFVVARDGVPEGKGLPFDRRESEFLIAVAARATLWTTLGAVEQPGGRGLAPPRRAADDGRPLLGTINDSSFERYYRELVGPYYRERTGGEVDIESLLAVGGLAYQEGPLRELDTIRLVTNANDFIVSSEQLDWLGRLAGDRMVVFPDGGHLGNLWEPTVQDAIFAALEE